MYEDRNITCVDCGQEFVFTASEQAFYAEKGFTDAPKRCKACRQARKTERGGYGPREMHKVTCSNCGKDAEVPFEPRGDRPVYCSDCFAQQRSGGGGGGNY